jgi:cytoskeleton protein RodZ
MNAVLDEGTETEMESRDFLREGPGSFLRSVREDRGWDVAYVSTTLHLDEEIILALENNAFDALPDKVFVTGYLRKYARLLEQPLDPLLQAYENACPQRKIPQAPKIVSRPEEIRSSHAVVRSFSYLIVLGILVLAGLWWAAYLQQSEPNFLKKLLEAFHQDDAKTTEMVSPGMKDELMTPASSAVIGTESHTPQSPAFQTNRTDTAKQDAVVEMEARGTSSADSTVSPNQANADADMERRIIEEQSASAAEPSIAGGVASALEAESGAQPENLSAAEELPEAVVERERIQPLIAGGSDTAEEVESQQPGNSVGVAAIGPDTDTPTGTAQAVEARSPAKVPVTAETTTEADAGTTAERREFTMELELLESSWVNIKDGSGKLMVLGNLKKGTKRQISGSQAPVSLVFGRAKGVSLKVNGKPMDLAPHIRKDVARLELDATALGLSD